jgi:hypothetical protein
MSFAEFFRDFWWLMFPLFGMLMAVMGMFQSERQQRTMIDLIKSYTDQGKEPPPELLKLAAQSLESEQKQQNSSDVHSRAWSVIVFTALAAGFGVGYFTVQAEDWSWAFLLVTVVMSIMAVGALLILIFGRKA